MPITKKRLKEYSARHYDEAPLEFFEYLGKSLGYSCPIHEEETTNDEALINKCKKYVQLGRVKSGHRICEWGQGWGAFCKYVTENFNVDYTCFNVSKEQTEYCKEHNKKAKFYNKSLHDSFGKYDRLFSDGNLVHQRGRQQEFFDKAYESLEEGGIFLCKDMFAVPVTKIPQQVCRGLNMTFFGSGEYRTLDEAEANARKAGFRIVKAHEIWIDSYIRTMELWLEEMIKNKERMMELNAQKYTRDYLTWNLFINLFKLGYFELWIMICHK